MSMIILEGVDGTGKTTLAHSLSEIKGWPIVNLFDGENYNNLRDMDIPVEDYHEDIYFQESWLRLGRPDCILDRSIISGCVYNGSVESLKALKYWEEKIEIYKDEVLIIQLKANNNTVYRRDEEWKGKYSELHHLRFMYNIIMEMLSARGLNIEKIRTDSKSKKEVLNEVVNCL